MAERSHLIFVSYRGSDQNWATELVYARMTEAFGADAIFKAGNAIQIGEEYPSVLRRQAASCPIMLACIGPGWLTATAPNGGRRLDSPDDWVRDEIATSLRAGNHVVPLLIGNHNEVAVPELDLVPESIRAMFNRQAWRLAPGAGLDVTMPKLVDSLTALAPELAERRHVRPAKTQFTTQLASAVQVPQDENSHNARSLMGRDGQRHDSLAVTNLATGNAHVGVQTGQFFGSVRTGADAGPPKNDIISLLTGLRGQLDHACRDGRVDEEVGQAALEELDTATEAAQANQGKRLKIAVKRLSGLISDLAEFSAKLAAIVSAVRGMS